MLLLLGIIVFLSYAYVSQINTLVTEQTKSHILEVAEQNADAVTQSVQADLRRVGSLASSILGAADLQSPNEELTGFLRKQAASDGYSRITITDTAGRGYTSDGQTVDLSQSRNYLKALQGTPNMSKPQVEDTAGNAAVTYSVPMKEGGAIKGVLMCTQDISVVSTRYSGSFLNGMGSYYVVSQNGEIIFHSDPQMVSKNILQLIDESASPEQVRRFSIDILNGKSSIAAFRLNGEDVYLGYVPIKDVNGWYIISAVSREAVASQATDIITISFYACLFILVACLLLVISVMAQKSRTRKLMLKAALEDPVTKCPNSNKFIMDAEPLLERRGKRHYALIYFDINKFRLINDSFGHQIGDRMLCEIAGILREILRPDQPFGHISGDHFVILTSYSNLQADIVGLVERLFSHVRRISINNFSAFNLTLAVGIYCVQENETDINNMINRASMARTNAKGSHESRFAFFSDQARSTLLEEASLESEMEAALRTGQFVPFYQPLIDFHTGQIVGAEALIRWSHPIKGLIPPGKFIPLFERNGFINKVDRFMLQQICRQIREHLDRGLTVPRISLNLSRVLLGQKDLVPFIQTTVLRHGLSPSMIEFELTESAFYDNLDYLIEIMNKLRTLGFTVAMDDFGVGYSSLHMLKKMPVDVLKLDREALSGIETDERSRSIVRMMVALGHELQFTVVSEGVESFEQANFLRGIGSDLAQGYVFARPMPAEEFYHLLLSRDVRTGAAYTESSRKWIAQLSAPAQPETPAAPAGAPRQ